MLAAAGVLLAAPFAFLAVANHTNPPETLSAAQAQLNAVPWIDGDRGRDLAEPAGPGSPEFAAALAARFAQEGWKITDSAYGGIDDGPAVTITLEGAPACATARVSALGSTGQIVAVRITRAACR